MQTVLAKIVADKAIWVEARKAEQPLASFQNDVVPAAVVSMTPCRAHAPRLFWSAKRPLRQKALFVTISTRRVLPVFISIMRQPSPC
jgi:hypothetical protein